MNNRIEKIVIFISLLCLILGIVIRFMYPYGFEFKEDEANALIIANQAIKTQILPLQGLISSINIPNPPFLIYSMLPFVYIHSGVIFNTYMFVIANIIAMLLTFFFVRRYFSKKASLYSLCFYAVSTWAMIMSRKIWAQNLLPLFSILVIFSSFLFIEKKRFFYPVIAAFCASYAFGTHFSGAALVALTFVFLFFVEDEFKSKYIVCLFTGYLISFIVWYPFVMHVSEMIKAGIFHTRGAGFAFVNLKAVFYPLAYISNWSINDLLSIDGGTAFRKFLGLPLFGLFHVFSLSLVILCAYSVYFTFKIKDKKYKMLLAAAIIPTCMLLFLSSVHIFYFIVATPALFILMGTTLENLSAKKKLIIAVSCLTTLIFNFTLLIFLDSANFFSGNFKMPIGRTYELKDFILEKIDCPQLNYVDQNVPIYVSYVLDRIRYNCSDDKKVKQNVYISYAVEGRGQDFKYPNMIFIGPYKVGW